MGVASNVHARLITDPTLSALAAEYEGGPAIVVGDHAIEDLPRPWVLVDGPDSDDPDDCKVEDGRDVTIPIRVVDDYTGSTLTVEAMAERVRALLHRRPDGLADGAYIATCSGPRATPTDTDLCAREVLLRIRTRTDPTSPEES